MTKDIDTSNEAFTFQVLMRLQYLRSRLRDWTAYASAPEPGTNQIEEVLWALQGMAVAARAGGLDAYARVCLHLVERLEPLRCNAKLRWTFLIELGVWLASSGHYLRHPDNPGAVADLVGRLNVLPWEAPMSQDEQSSLFRALLRPH